MTTSRDPDARLAAYLADGMDALPDRVVDAVLDEVHRTRQRADIGPWRTLAMHSVLKIALPTAAVIAVVAAGVSFLPRDAGVAAPGPVTAPPIASPSPEPSPEVRATRMTVAGTALQLTAALPAGWTTHSDYAANVLGGPPTGAAFFVSVIDNTFSDPCLHIQRDPQVDTTVAAWLTAIGDIPHIGTTEPVRTTIAGYEADLIEITIPASLPCLPDRFYLWQDSPQNYWWVGAAGETIRVWVLEVGGQPVAIAGRTVPATTSALDAELLAVLDSIVFEEPARPSASATTP